jgi:hypothetical protein
MTDAEFASVVELSAPDRYEYSVKRAADRQQLWTLGGADGLALAADDEGHELVPVWPHPRLAEACAQGDWEGMSPRSVELDAWLDRWLPGIERDGRMLAVFPTPTGAGVVVTSDKFRSDLDEELANY